ncbi:hypothetical protein ACWDY4_46570, partial [Streptomyces olivaceoviridis]
MIVVDEGGCVVVPVLLAVRCGKGLDVVVPGGVVVSDDGVGVGAVPARGVGAVVAGAGGGGVVAEGGEGG